MDSSLRNYVRIKTAANIFGVTPQTIRNWVSAGKLKAIRHPVNGYRLFNLEEIEQAVGALVKGQSRQGFLISLSDAYPKHQRVVHQEEASPCPAQSAVIPANISSRTPSNNAGKRDNSSSLSLGDEFNDADSEWIRRGNRSIVTSPEKIVRVGDVFCGGGIFSLGVSEALSQLNIQAQHIFGIDFDKDAIETFSYNFTEALAIHADILELANGKVLAPATDQETAFLAQVGGTIDILVGGPPCQGHSDLNNHTRRDDPRNGLYFSMVRLSELLQPSFVLIENVPGVVHDRGDVVKITTLELQRMGYYVSSAKVDLRRIGVPQKRARFVLVASKHGMLNIQEALSYSNIPDRPVSWALQDLLNSYDESTIYDSSAVHSETNRKRIKFLFDHDLYELPNEQRPPCHRDKKHSYNSVYGRMRWDAPAPTITGGFGSTGQGRFVHPLVPRTLTPHEACRIQCIPDFFRFPPGVGRRSMQQIIGNAAPPKLSQVLILGAAIQGVLL